MNDVLKKYEKAREISNSVLEFAKSIVKEDAKILEIAESIESKIKEFGGGVAFPVNISINENAAHYTPTIDDATRVKAGDLVKIDFGVHVDGYIWDRAFSVIIGKEKNNLIEAAEKAVEEAIKIVKPGVKVYEISEIIENTLREFEVRPVYNLCGHGLKRFTQHAEPTIPNYKNNLQYEIKDGEVIAIEVFTTNGFGLVKESNQVFIYKYEKDRPVRMWEARKILRKAKSEFMGMPFAKRWVRDVASGVALELALKQLVESGSLREYPVLREDSGSLVAQAEETVIVR
ncbi:MAG: type II methionyl aminopeptidase [Candidatus Aenigmarchaeota archaeon]|nr:type II methionyl aminopeptidase [Candidatus Aenigmarchaeota archaeon]